MITVVTSETEVIIVSAPVAAPSVRSSGTTSIGPASVAAASAGTPARVLTGFTTA